MVYFHGAPGAPGEAAVFDACGKIHGVRILAFDRFVVEPSVRGDDYYRLLASEIQRHTRGEKVVVVGFSIGAFVALQTCRHMAGSVARVHLVSAGAPLEAGDFLNAMAGKQVFQLAQGFPFVFFLLSLWQGVLARWAPKALFAMLFASAQGGDKRLAADAQFRATLIEVLRSSFVGAVRGYTRDITAYVQPWKDSLAHMHFPVRVWHGLQDNWSPPAMATALYEGLPQCESVTLLEGLSHYSCLLEAAPTICGSQCVL